MRALLLYFQAIMSKDLPPLEKAFRVASFIFIIYFSVGVGLMVLQVAPPFGPLSDFLFIFFAALVVFLRESLEIGARRAGIAFFWVGGVSALIESIGTLTGFPFGSYEYTEAFGPRLAGILPLSIPLAWWLVVLPVYRLLPNFRLAGFFSFTCVAALLITSIDFVIEPVAVGIKGYWIWEKDGFYYGVPLSNFLGWYATAWLIVGGLLGIERLGPRRSLGQQRRTEKTHFLMITATLLFFMVVLLVAGIWMPIFLGLALIGIFAYLLRRS